MKLIVREHVTAVAEPIKKVYNVTIDAVNNFQKIPASIGIKKGDIIIFRGSGDPIRLPVGNVAGRILTADPDAEGGASWQPPSGGSGSSVTLHNITGVTVAGGTVVKIDTGYNFVKATSADTTMLFVTADDCPAGEDVACYSTANTICSVLCTAAAVAVNDQLAVSSTDGIAETTSGQGFAVALSAKAAGSSGPVDAMIVQAGFLPLSGGTLSGDVDLANAEIHAKSSGIDEDATPVSLQEYAPLEWYDKNGDKIGRIQMYQDTSDKIGMQLGIRRYISGSWVWKELKLTIDASGNWTYDFGNAAAARDALGLGATSGAVPIANGGTGATSAADARTNLGFQNGFTATSPASVNIADDTETTIFTMALSTGLYLLNYEAVFAKNQNGYRRLRVTNNADSDYGGIYEDTCRANASDVSICRATVFHNVTGSTETLKFKVTQNSGSTLSTAFRYQYMKLG